MRANEEAVALFLANALGFTRIVEVIGAALDAHRSSPEPSLEQVVEADTWARDFARRWIADQ